MGNVDADGTVLSPFTWDTARRLDLRAKLDAVFFHLYGFTDRDDISAISIPPSPSSSVRKRPNMAPTARAIYALHG